MKKRFSLIFLTIAFLAGCDFSFSIDFGKNKNKNPEEENNQQVEPTQNEDKSQENNGEGLQTHEHDYVFDCFIWDKNDGVYTAQARYVCSANDGYFALFPAYVKNDTTQHIDYTCTTNGQNVWIATYDIYSESKIEVLKAKHDWDVQWVWANDNSSATAYLTCQRCGKEEVQAGKISFTYKVVPTCEETGIANYSATITASDGQIYAYIKPNVVVPASHELNEHQFCTNCGMYLGYDVSADTPFYLDEILGSNNKGYFRFRFNENKHYFICLNGWVHDLLDYKFFYLNNNSELVDITDIDLFYDNTSNWMPINLNELLIDSKDSYLYVEILEFDNALDPITAQLEVCTDHTEPNEYGYCLGGDFLGELGTLNTSIILGNFAAGVKKFVKYSLLPEQEYQLTYSGLVSSELSVYYFSKSDNSFISLERINGIFTTPSSAEFNGDIIVVATATVNIFNATINVVIIHNHNYIYGLCSCGDYIGEDLMLNVEASPISLNNGDYAYFRFNLSNLPENNTVLYVQYTSGYSSATCISYKNVSLYYFENGVPFNLDSDDWYGGNWDGEYYPTSYISSDDGFIYIVIYADKDYSDSPGFMIEAIEER